MTEYTFHQDLRGSVNSDVAADVTLGGLNDIKVDSKLGSDSNVVATVNSDGKLATDSKVKSDSSVSTDSKVATTSNVDLAPVAVDTCVRVELGPLPPTRVSTPWEQRFGLSVLGYELIAWTVSGRTATTIAPVTPEPRIVGAIEHGHVEHHGHDVEHHGSGSDRPGRDDDRHGLHIRLG
jgi:hypothetical protein